MELAQKGDDEIVDFFARGGTSAEILAFRPSAEAPQRVRYLLSRNKTGELTSDEAAGLERFGEMEHLMQLVKARAPLRAGAAVSVTYIPSALRRQIDERAKGKCGYCLLAENYAFFTHEADHIISEKHGGKTVIENLALSCFDCNRFKGSDIASVDPLTESLVRLFNPRTQN